MTPLLIFIIPPIYAVANEANNILAQTHWFKKTLDVKIGFNNAEVW